AGARPASPPGRRAQPGGQARVPAAARGARPRCRAAARPMPGRIRTPRTAPMVDYTGVRIGIDLGGTKIEAIALDDAGEVLVRRRMASPRGDYARTLAVLTEVVAAIERELGTRGTVGVGIPGTISSATGLVKN